MADKKIKGYHSNVPNLIGGSNTHQIVTGLSVSDSQHLLSSDEVVKDLDWFLDEESKKKGYDSYKTILKRLASYKTPECRYDYLKSIQPDIILEANISWYKYQLEEQRTEKLHWISKYAQAAATIEEQRKEINNLTDHAQRLENVVSGQLEKIDKLTQEISQRHWVKIEGVLFYKPFTDTQENEALKQK